MYVDMAIRVENGRRRLSCRHWVPLDLLVFCRGPVVGASSSPKKAKIFGQSNPNSATWQL